MNKFLTITVFAMLLITSVIILSTKDNSSALPPDVAQGEAAIGGAFSLTDMHGKSVSDVDFRGRYMLVFFGFTHCPGICPTALATITRSLQDLGDAAQKIHPLFITVDPARDTPEVLARYLANFDSRILGLTGSEAQIKAASDAYKVFHSAEAAAQGANYNVDHSGFIYLMNPQGKYLSHASYDISPDLLTTTLREQVK